jgi:hypothetical protein
MSTPPATPPMNAAATPQRNEAKSVASKTPSAVASPAARPIVYQSSPNTRQA